MRRQRGRSTETNQRELRRQAARSWLLPISANIQNAGASRWQALVAPRYREHCELAAALLHRPSVVFLDEPASFVANLPAAMEYRATFPGADRRYAGQRQPLALLVELLQSFPTRQRLATERCCDYPGDLGPGFWPGSRSLWQCARPGAADYDRRARCLPGGGAAQYLAVCLYLGHRSRRPG
jgi:hypothetical protein